jgi:hypothetical protein
MKKNYVAILIGICVLLPGYIQAQCHPQIANMSITQPTAPISITSSKCQYTFSFSFDVITNGGFKYLFFHSWLANDYPSPAIFNCSSSAAQSPGTSAQLGTNVDDVGKSFLDIGFRNLNTVTFPANTAVDVTSYFATLYEHDPTVTLTQPSNSPGLTAFITRQNNSDTLHFDISMIKVIVNSSCNAPILGKTDVWGSNMNPPSPKAQCYICALTHSFNDPFIALVKQCITSPFKYAVGITSAYTSPVHITYKVYMHDPQAGPFPVSSDQLIYTSSPLAIDASNPYSSGFINLPNPYCCVDPYAQYGVYVRVTAQEFSNIFQSEISEPACATLPIKLRSFTAVRNNSNVTLKWETESEENSKGFYIQRKSGNTDWQTVSFVNTKAVNGNSQVPLTYEYTEPNYIKGITQYRLRQMDNDGKSAYSNIRSVRSDGQKGLTIIYPNPSTDGKVNIVFDDAVGNRDVSLLDLSGRQVRQWKGVNTNTIQIENLNPGFYSVRILNVETGEQVIEKIIVKNR